MSSAKTHAARATRNGRRAAGAVAERLRSAASNRRHHPLAWARRRATGPGPLEARPDGDHATGHRERERKFEAPTDFELPTFDDVSGVTVLGDEVVDLVAVYYDTPDLRLTRSGVSLRYRSDERWTVKLPEGNGGKALVRTENRFPGTPGDPPREAVDLVTAWARREKLRPVAKVETRRHRVELGDDGSKPIAEIADDEVIATTPASRRPPFREVEIELLAGAENVLEKRIVTNVRAAGATRASGMPKIKRALGRRAAAPSELDAAMPKKPKTVRDVTQLAVVGSARRLIDHDAAVRQGEDPEAVHQARVATRRLRSDLRTFRPVLDRRVTDPLRDELRWLGARLGDVRDADVLAELLRDRLALLNESENPAAAALRDRLEAQRSQARATLDIAMTSERYRQLLERLVELAQSPPMSGKAADRSAKKALPRLVRRPWRRVRKAADHASDPPTDAELHEARKRAKQARYAAEAAEPVIGKPAKRFARAMERLQDDLGEHQDAVVARSWLEDAAHASRDRDAILLAGKLAGVCAAQRDLLHHRWLAQWRAASRKRLRRWL